MMTAPRHTTTPAAASQGVQAATDGRTVLRGLRLGRRPSRGMGVGRAARSGGAQATLSGRCRRCNRGATISPGSEDGRLALYQVLAHWRSVRLAGADDRRAGVAVDAVRLGDL